MLLCFIAFDVPMYVPWQGANGADWGRKRLQEFRIPGHFGQQPDQIGEARRIEHIEGTDVVEVETEFGVARLPWARSCGAVPMPQKAKKLAAKPAEVAKA